MSRCLVRTVPIVVRAPRAAVLEAPDLVPGETVLIVPAGVPVATMIDVPVATLTPIAHGLLVTTMTGALAVVSEIHRAAVFVVPMNPGIADPPVTPIVTTTDHVGHSSMETAALRVTTTVVRLAPTGETTVAPLAMVALVQPDRLPVGTAVVRVTVAPARHAESSMTAVEHLAVTMIVVHRVHTAAMIAVLRATEGLVRPVVNSMTAVVVLAAQVRRERVRPVASTTAVHVNVGVKTVPRSHVHHVMSHVRVFNVMMPGLVLIGKTHGRALIAMSAHGVVVRRTAIVGSVHLRPKSKSALMPNALPSLVVGVA